MTNKDKHPGALEFILNTPVHNWRDGDDVEDGFRKSAVDAIVCNDGTIISVQASETHYCKPRSNYGPWYLVEVGFPTATPPDSWHGYFEGEFHSNRIERFFKVYRKSLFRGTPRKYYDNYLDWIGDIYRHVRRTVALAVSPIGCDSIYAWIPVELVREYIEAHGGELA